MISIKKCTICISLHVFIANHTLFLLREGVTFSKVLMILMKKNEIIIYVIRNNKRSKTNKKSHDST